MSFFIRQIENLTDAQEQALFHWNDDVFDSKQHHLVFMDSAEWSFAGFEDERIVSHVGLVKQKIVVGDREIWVGGVCGVSTVPEAQGRGYASRILQRVVEFMSKDLQVDFGTLFCNHELIPFYRGASWQKFDGEVTVEQPDGNRLTPPTINFMFLPLRENTQWPDGEVDLKSLPW